MTRRRRNPPSQSAFNVFFSGWFQANCKKKTTEKVSNSLNSMGFPPSKEVNLRHVPKCLKALPTLPLNQQQQHLKMDA